MGANKSDPMIEKAGHLSNQIVSGAGTDDAAAGDANLKPDIDATGSGRIIGIRGGVVDVLFPETSPRIYDLLYASKVPLEVPRCSTTALFAASHSHRYAGSGLAYRYVQAVRQFRYRWAMHCWDVC